MRQFKLVDGSNQEFDLMNKNAFFYAPDGLGFDKNIETAQIGQSFIVIKEELAQKSITGTMVFNGYANFKTFVEFVSEKSLKLLYKPIDKWYYINCKVQNLTKGEISNSSGKLECQVTFLCLGTWYETLESRNTSGTIEGGKIYNYQYSYEYSSVNNKLTIENGSIESSCKISIFGACVNPHWEVRNNGITYATGTVNVTIPSGNKLVIDASPESIEISEYTMNNVFVAKRYSSSDFSTERFIYLRAGENIIEFSDNGGGVISAFVEVKKLAESV